MKKLYNHSKGKIHPSSTIPDHNLSLLPLAIATLAATLPPQDQQVLAYLLSISSTTFTNGKPTNNSDAGGDHPPQFNCSCFRCYTTFWIRWDASPNRKVIHEIIDAYEDGLIRTKKNKKERIKNKKYSPSAAALHSPPATAEIVTPETAQNMNGDEGESEKGSVRKIVNFIGERIWGVWGI